MSLVSQFAVFPYHSYSFFPFFTFRKAPSHSGKGSQTYRDAVIDSDQVFLLVVLIGHVKIFAIKASSKVSRKKATITDETSIPSKNSRNVVAFLGSMKSDDADNARE